MRRAFLVVLALSVLTVAVRAEDVDPEPPARGGPELRKLKGTWVVVRLKFKGHEIEQVGRATYSFDGDKVTLHSVANPVVSKLKVDAKNKPPVLEMIRQDTKTIQRMAFKIENGELLLAAVPVKGGNAKEDFSGNNGFVLVLKREKKKE